jgi:hypothetical protein
MVEDAHGSAGPMQGCLVPSEASTHGPNMSRAEVVKVYTITLRVLLPLAGLFYRILQLQLVAYLEGGWATGRRPNNHFDPATISNNRLLTIKATGFYPLSLITVIITPTSLCS